ncbi:MAG: hypothetical protein WC315_00195 [Candidatus Omnitrophota bacterium]|jgi:hypothetical protein
MSDTDDLHPRVMRAWALNMLHGRRKELDQAALREDYPEAVLMAINYTLMELELDLAEKTGEIEPR